VTLPNRTKRDFTVAAITVAFLVAVFGGSYAAKQLLQSGAAVHRLDVQRRYAQLQKASGRPAVAPYLGPFARNPKQGRVCGPEVRLMEGALRRTHPPIRKAPPQNCIGAATVKQLRAFQRRQHIPPTGIYGLRTHKALSHAYTKRMRADLAYVAAKRLRALRIATIGIVTAHAQRLQGLMQYCEFGSLSSCGRRWSWPTYPDVPRHTDCSGYVTWVYYQAGLSDPNANGYRGGFTGTLVAHGTPVRPNGPLHVGDLVFNGPSASNTTHVSIYIGHGLTSGHGRAGIQIHPWNYRIVVAIRRYF
jgi:cell wall-associated NlpC family hydrolase